MSLKSVNMLLNEILFRRRWAVVRSSAVEGTSVEDGVQKVPEVPEDGFNFSSSRDILILSTFSSLDLEHLSPSISTFCGFLYILQSQWPTSTPALQREIPSGSRSLQRMSSAVRLGLPIAPYPTLLTPWLLSPVILLRSLQLGVYRQRQIFARRNSPLQLRRESARTFWRQHHQGQRERAQEGGQVGQDVFLREGPESEDGGMTLHSDTIYA